MVAMEFLPLSDPAEWIRALPRSGLLLGALAAMLAGVAGSLLIRHVPRLGRLLRAASTLSLMGILVLVVLQVARFDSRFDMVLPQIGLPRQEVVGGETRIPLAPDGHFWIDAQVEDRPARFMVDTGATLTAISANTARQAGLEPRPGAIPITLTTANGAISADLTTIDLLKFGNIEARRIDAVIAPNLGTVNVMGMNVLSRLGGWRVENNVLILSPRQVEAAAPGN
jgi:aspartyl protease family protein